MAEKFPTSNPSEARHDMQVEEAYRSGPVYSGETFPGAGDSSVAESSHYTAIGTRHGAETTTEYRDTENSVSQGPDSAVSAAQNGMGYTESTKHFATTTEFANKPGEKMRSAVTIDQETGSVKRASRERIVADPVTGETSVQPIAVDTERMGRAALRLSGIYERERAAQAEQEAAQQEAA